MIDQKKSSEETYRMLLKKMTGVEYSEGMAVFHYNNITEHQDRLMRSLGRDVAFSVAALDYFTYVKPVLEKPRIIDEKDYQTIIRQNYTDDLTGVYTRGCLQQKLAEEIRKGEERYSFFSVVFIDLDNFGEINNKYGHRAGDAVLLQFAHLVKHSSRRRDAIFRYGGEEFIIVMPDTTVWEAYRFCERMRNKMEKKPIRIDGDITICATLSGGVANYPNDARQADELIEKADQAMYSAKRKGKNNVVLYKYLR